MGEWLAIEERVAIYPSTIKNRVCIVSLENHTFRYGILKGSIVYSDGNSIWFIDSGLLAIANVIDSASNQNRFDIYQFGLPKPSQDVDKSLAYSPPNQRENAINAFNQSGCTNSLPHIAFKQQADRHYANNEYQQAIAAYTEAIRLSPRYAALYYNRGISYNLSGKSKEAIADLQKAAQLYREQGKENDYKEAIEQIAAIKKTLPSNSLIASQSLCKFVEADHQSTQGITIEPGKSGKDFKKLIGTYAFAVDRLGYKDLDSGARVLSFDVFNLGYAHGVIEVRDAQGKLVECRGVDGIENQDNVIDFGLDSIKRLYQLATEGYGFMDPRNSLGNSQKTEIRNIFIPPGGTLKFTKIGNVALRYNQAKTIEYFLSKTDGPFKKGDPSLKVKLLSSFMAKFESEKVADFIKDGSPINVSEAIKGSRSVDWVDQTELKRLIDISEEVLEDEIKDQFSDRFLSSQIIGKLNLTSILAGFFSQGASMYLQWGVDRPMAERIEPKTQQIIFISKNGR